VASKFFALVILGRIAIGANDCGRAIWDGA
jgi:hypothetical protein